LSGLFLSIRPRKPVFEVEEIKKDELSQTAGFVFSLLGSQEH
jgi:hypothetical protein